MKTEFFDIGVEKMEPWIMIASAAKSKRHLDPRWDDVGWVEPVLGPVKLTLMDEGDFWPDIIGCGSMPGFYVSARVKQSFDAEGIDYGKCVATQIVGDLPPLLVDVPPPDYYWMGLRLGAKRDMVRSGYSNVRTSPRGIVYGDDPQRVVLVDGSWDGSALFVTEHPVSHIFCTRRIIDLATRYGWTNFKFVPIEHIYDRPFHPGIPY